MPKKDHTTSSGNRSKQKINQKVRKLKIKITRWKRYKKEIEDDQRKGKISRWDTSGLERYIKLLESL